jgi:hypothetical protein
MSSLRGLAFVVAAALAACGGSRADVGAGTDAGPNADDAGPSPPLACSASAAADIEVASVDLNAYPPYAIDGCTLVYVAARGALVIRDLATGTEAVLTGPSERPRRPAISDSVVVWEATMSEKDVVRVWPRAARPGEAPPITIDRFAHAREPRAAGNSVVFTAWKGPAETDDTDIYVYDAAIGEPRLVLGGSGQQRFADVSRDFVAVTDFSEDPDGTYDRNATDLADVVLVERATGTVVRRRAPGKQAFPLLVSADRLAYMHWGDIHPEPKFTLYQLKAGGLRADVASDVVIADVKNMSGVEVRFGGSNGVLEWIANPDGSTSLLRAPADGSQPPAAASGLEDLVLFAPVSSPGITVVAAIPARSTSPGAPRLRSVAR